MARTPRRRGRPRTSCAATIDDGPPAQPRSAREWPILSAIRKFPVIALKSRDRLKGPILRAAFNRGQASRTRGTAACAVRIAGHSDVLYGLVFALPWVYDHRSERSANGNVASVLHRPAIRPTLKALACGHASLPHGAFHGFPGAKRSRRIPQGWLPRPELLP